MPDAINTVSLTAILMPSVIDTIFLEQSRRCRSAGETSLLTASLQGMDRPVYIVWANPESVTIAIMVQTLSISHAVYLGGGQAPLQGHGQGGHYL